MGKTLTYLLVPKLPFPDRKGMASYRAKRDRRHWTVLQYLEAEEMPPDRDIEPGDLEQMKRYLTLPEGAR